MEYRLNTKKPHLLCLILLISFPSVAAVLISPALPKMGDFFNVSDGYIQQLIVIFIAGYALGQLIYSPFANRFGRKIAAYIGVTLYLISCVICLLGIHLHNVEIIFIGRFLMALGSSVGMIISYTIINDFYHAKQARPIMSYTALAYAFMPAVAIAIGGFITTHLNWIDCFYFYLFYGFVILLVVTRLPETLQNKKLNALKTKILLQDYCNAFRSLRLVLFSIIYGLMGAFIYIIASGGPFIGIDTIGLSSARYGMLMLIPYFFQFIGAFSSARLSKNLSIYHVIKLGYANVIFGSLFMFVSFMFHWVTIFSLIAPICFIMAGLPMIYSNTTIIALTEHEDKATGSAVMSFITMLVCLIATFTLTLLPNQNPITMPAIFIIVSALAIIFLWQGKKRFSF